MNLPQWATPERRQHLAELASSPCSFHEEACPVVGKFSDRMVALLGSPTQSLAWAWVFRASLATPRVLQDFTAGELGHLSFWAIKDLIATWKAEDREARERLWKLEKRRLHAAPQIRRRGPFDTIRREEHMAHRPVFRIVGLGVNAFTQHRVAKVEIPGLGLVVWVDLAGITTGVSRNKLRKLVRYGKGSLPKELVPKLEVRVQERIREYLK